jgi:CheY-like chemotaxis protein
LLIEDNPSDVRLVREALKETFIPVNLAVARDGLEATEYLNQAEAGAVVRPDLVLLDLDMPRKNGRELLSELKSSPTLKQIPVVVMTSSLADEDVRLVYSLNANCFVRKPNDLVEYINVIQGIEDFWFLTATLPDTFQYGFVPQLTRQLAS